MKKILILMVIGLASLGSIANADDNMKPRSDIAFVLVYMSTCPHCQRFDPILKQYILQNHIETLAYTVNGTSLPSFKNSVTPTQEELDRLFPNGNPVVPSLFVVDMKHHQMIRALTGEANYEQLSQRVAKIEQYIGSED